MNRSSFSMVSILLVLSAVFLVSSRLEAQFTCSGSICGYFPGGITNDLNGTLGRVEREYLQEVLKKNTEASFMNQIVSNSVGTGSVSHFQLGVSAGGAGIKKDDIIIQNEKIKLPNLPNAGVSLQPNINFDFNLGWILGLANDSFARRFSIYLHGMDVQISEGDAKGLSSVKENLRFQGRVKSAGGMVRFQAMQPITFGFSLFTWTGVNIGVGYHYSKQDYTLVSLNGQAQKMELNGIVGKWGGDTTMDYQTETKTYNLDVRSGLGMFWMLTIYAGGGYSWNSGSSSVNLNRTGPFVLQTNGLQDVNIPREYQSYFNQDKTVTQAGTLGLNTSSRGGSKRSIAYAIGGLELDLILLKATLEAIYGNKDLYGGSIAFRFSF